MQTVNEVLWRERPEQASKLGPVLAGQLLDDAVEGDYLLVSDAVRLVSLVDVEQPEHENPRRESLSLRENAVVTLAEQRAVGSLATVPAQIVGPDRDHDHARVTRCLLYTSDAADDLTRVDLGGRRIVQKK